MFYTREIIGATRRETDSLLCCLTGLARAPEWQVRFRWRSGSVAIWDNRAVQHYAVNDCHPTRRRVSRVAVH